ncbi:MAG: DUF4416 family protein [Spirochaetales bacterium]|nr:DUF4416 family protein [Spirochaetales bacterium]
MGKIDEFVKEKLITGLLLSSSIDIDKLKVDLENAWGPIDYMSPEVPFDFTSYYDGEMGPGIRRYYLSFETLVSPEALSQIKIKSNEMEFPYMSGENRQVNIDPGLLSLKRLILASSKDAGHRIPLSSGIYGEVTLVYQSKGFKTLDWTYPDYKSDFCREEMKKVREIYKKQLRN